ncbi:hypothetical protein DMC01_07055 [Campylobacter troglodytis]|nr:hypothetical protein DMC01_07055 [Campylobacter troglodytis]
MYFRKSSLKVLNLRHLVAFKRVRQNKEQKYEFMFTKTLFKTVFAILSLSKKRSFLKEAIF